MCFHSITSVTFTNCYVHLIVSYSKECVDSSLLSYLFCGHFRFQCEHRLWFIEFTLHWTAVYPFCRFSRKEKQVYSHNPEMVKGLLGFPDSLQFILENSFPTERHYYTGTFHIDLN